MGKRMACIGRLDSRVRKIEKKTIDQKMLAFFLSEKK